MAPDGTIEAEHCVHHILLKLVELSHRPPATSEEEKIRTMLDDETYHLFRVRTLPLTFTGNDPVYLFDTWLHRSVVAGGHLDKMPFIVCLIHPQIQPAILPIPISIAGPHIQLIKKAPTWYSPADPTPREQCPCCDYVSLPERGSYLICHVCFWEDDGQDIDQLDEESGPNHGLTLREGRSNFKAFGACEREMVSHVMPASQRERYEFRPRQIA